jgi:purine-binding chemotaxis protein CheW
MNAKEPQERVQNITRRKYMNETITKTNSPEKEKSRRTILPPSGLAEDVLKREEPAQVHPETSEAPTGPERIYAFADTLGSAESTKEEEEQLEIWVTFTLDHEIFSLPVSVIHEILRVTTITKVPHAPEPVRGITNMRGRVLPVVDLRIRLGMKAAEADNATRILVVESKKRLIGLLVDSVQQVMRLSTKGIEPLNPDVMTAQADYITGVFYLQDNLIFLLNVDRLLLMNNSLHTAEKQGE